ncbi:RNA-binding protein [Coprinopsis cinerea okayama7|uniref:Nucleolar protein 12 n=1 Tax=Coprinopsis cinerea (strain Okayama-7 / 130 / ATCC MYA-4618 / FGSC 9003) TaxID=240176 RepID=A8NPY3_COPC7|nr:RNA-binding protein [Coprinopsis cinerea okayama7\|eukprot:XP_001835432.2 RNA-binding protein [Coprinopsis cinerea okayama7\
MASFLLGKTVDQELDSLFKSAPKPVPSTSEPVKDTVITTTTAAPQPKGGKKRKTDDGENETEKENEKRSKKVKIAETTTAKMPKSSSTPASAKDKDKEMGKKSKKKNMEKEKAGKQDVLEDDSEDDEELAKIEERYLAGRAKSSGEKKKGKKSSKSKDKNEDKNNDEEDEDDEKDAPASDDEASAHSDSDSDSDEEDEDDGSIPVHESLKDTASQPSKPTRSKKKFVVPADETPEKRDKRTIFVGNLPLAVAEKRPLQKQLQKHILALVPTAKIESLRFRSVPFQAPTAKLPDDGTDKPTDKPKPKPRQHELDRASTWRSSKDSSLQDKKDEDALKKDEKRYLTPSQKKKIAFINQEFHANADTVNAYIVFAHPVDQSTRPKNLPPLPVTMCPYEAAKVAVERCNNTVFMERIIRVDRVGKVKGSGRKGAEEDEDGEEARPMVDADPKLSIFVGNLDFESKEEDLRVFFETLLVAEKGAPGGEGEETIEVDGVVIKKPKTWVTHVRIVRDRDTQLGKGFAYVQFADKDCVDEILAMDPTKVKFAKRKLRVQRCKSVPGTSLKIKSLPPPSSSKQPGKSLAPGLPQPKDQRRFSQPATPIQVPKGDPNLGERLAHLSKEDRKSVKAKDAERVARRLAKKKARMAMGGKVVGGGGKDGKERERDRSRKGGKKVVNTGRKTGKPRVRSEKAMGKRNMKKD